MPPNSDDPILEAGRRLVASFLGESAPETATITDARSTLIETVRHLVECRDVTQLRELLHGEW
jgi:hypothetical protein